MMMKYDDDDDCCYSVRTFIVPYTYRHASYSLSYYVQNYHALNLFVTLRKVSHQWLCPWTPLVIDFAPRPHPHCCPKASTEMTPLM